MVTSPIQAAQPRSSSAGRRIASQKPGAAIASASMVSRRSPVARFSEETGLRPKPMVEIGGRPILWHVMKLFSARGVDEFVICLGYRGYVIKEFFANYYLHSSDVTFDVKANRMEVHQESAEPWRV